MSQSCTKIPSKLISSAALLSIVASLFSILVAGGCAKDPKVAVNKAITPADNSAASSPLVPLTDNDYKVRTVHELMRAHMASLNLLSPPKAGTNEGCISFTPGRGGKNLLNAKYDCTWTETSSEPARGQLTWSMKDNETFNYDPTGAIPYQAAASLKVLVLRSSTPQKIALKTQYTRSVSLVPDPKTKGQMTIITSSAFGNSLDPKHQNWQVKIQGSWMSDTTKGLTLASGSTIVFTHYLPQTKKINATEVTYTVGGTGLTFDTSTNCAHPIGSLTWTKKFNTVPVEGTTGTGTLMLASTGASDGITDITWPTDSCLEFEGKVL